MERDPKVQKLKHLIGCAIRQKKSDWVIAELKTQLEWRLEYLDRHGLANNPKRRT